MTAAVILFAILFQSPPMATLAGSSLLVTVLHGYIAQFLSANFPDLVTTPSDVSKCAGRFPGVSYDRLLGLSLSSGFGSVAADAWPSYYTTFVGFLAGWIGALPSIYARELKASPKRASSVAGGILILILLCILVTIYRISSGCDGMLGTAIGLVFGFAIGLGLVLTASWISDRRATNILGMPLIRDKAADGKPIYVCERGSDSKGGEGFEDAAKGSKAAKAVPKPAQQKTANSNKDATRST